MHVPSRFNQKSFRIYETAIQAICLNYPNGTQIDPTPFSAETFCARCRDAITAYLGEYGKDWTSNVDRDLLRRVRKDVVFINAGSVVRIGPKHVLETKSSRLELPQFQQKVLNPRVLSQLPGDSHASLPMGIPTHNTSPEQVLVLLQKLSSGSVNGPVVLTGTLPLDAIESSIAGGQFDVEYKLQPDGSLILF